MTRIAAIIALTAFAAAPVAAASYSAKPIAAPAAKIVGKDIAWSCAAGSCRGSTETSRPLVICQDLAKRTGRLESFFADGRPLDSAQLEKCNAKAAAPTALAHAN